MLIPEEVSLLSWISTQQVPVSMSTMHRLNAPGFSRQRVEALQKSALLNRSISVENGSAVGVYSISDNGRRELLTLQETRRKEAEAKRQQILQNKLTVFVPVLTFFLGILAAHIGDILEFFKSLLKSTTP